jgi:hypothetical protein
MQSSKRPVTLIMEPKYLKSLGNQGFQHYTGLRVLTQMRGYPVWLDPCPGRYRAAGLHYFLRLSSQTSCYRRLQLRGPLNQALIWPNLSGRDCNNRILWA